MKAIKIIFLVAAIGVLAYTQRGRLSFFGAGNGVAITSLKGPPHVINTLRFAVEAANAEAKTLVYHFSLANCAPCDRLDDEVLSTRQWRDYARQNLKIIDVFMPNQFTSEDVRIVKNMEILEAIHDGTGASGGFPTVAVFSSDGRILGVKSGYGGSRAEGYISWIENLRKGDPNRPTKPTPAASVPAPTNATADAKTAAASPPAMTPPPATVAPVAAAPVANTTTNPPVVPVEAPKAPESYLKLKGILGGASPMVMINSGVKTYTIGAGDVLNMETPAGKISIRCDTVTKDRVIILVGDAKERVELMLP